MRFRKFQWGINSPVEFSFPWDLKIRMGKQIIRSMTFFFCRAPSMLWCHAVNSLQHFSVRANRFHCLLTTMHRSQRGAIYRTGMLLSSQFDEDSVSNGHQTALMDQTDDNDNFIPCEWRNDIVMHDLGTHQRGNVATQAVQQQITFLKANCSCSQICEVQWQRNIL